MLNKNMVALDFYKPEYRSLLEDYFLPGEQMNFTSLPLDAIKKCKQEDDRHPIVILYQNEPAGFFVLHGWDGVKEYIDNKEAILLRAYSINYSFQGEGIARRSLELLPLFVKENFPLKEEIILAVNVNNTNAQQVYKKCGFEDKGIRAMGPKGELLVYHMDV